MSASLKGLFPNLMILIEVLPSRALPNSLHWEPGKRVFLGEVIQMSVNKYIIATLLGVMMAGL